MEKVKLNKVDYKLLHALDVNARESLTQLGKKLRVSKQVVKYRIERLEEQGVITAFTALIDNSKLGYTTYRIYLKWKGLTAEGRKKHIAQLKDIPQIWAIIQLAGLWDLALGVSVKSVAQLQHIWQHLLKDLLPAISDYAVHIYEPITHYTKAYLLTQPFDDAPRVTGASKKHVDIDKHDRVILRELAHDARQSITSIAQRSELSIEAVRQRLLSLEKEDVIVGYRVQVDTSKLGLSYFKADVRLTDFKKLPAVLEFCRKHPNIIQVDQTVGGETIDIEFHVRDVHHMQAIMEELEEQVPHVVERYTYLTVLEQLKETYMPDA